MTGHIPQKREKKFQAACVIHPAELPAQLTGREPPTAPRTVKVGVSLKVLVTAAIPANSIHIHQTDIRSEPTRTDISNPEYKLNDPDR